MTSFSLEGTFGVVLIGVLTSSILYGFTTFQSLAYFRNAHQEPWHIKVLVFLVWTLDTVHVAISGQFIYSYLISHHANFLSLLVVEWSVNVAVGLTVIIKLLVGLFFINRIRFLGNNNYVFCLALLVCELSHFSVGMAVSITSFRYEFFTTLQEKAKGLIMAGLILGAVTDSIITFTLCNYSRRSAIMDKWNDSWPAVVSVFIVHNGAITGMTDIICLILFLVFPNSFAYVALYQLLSKFYANSLLATLNSKADIVASESSWDASHGGNSIFRRIPRIGGKSIRVERHDMKGQTMRSVLGKLPATVDVSLAERITGRWETVVKKEQLREISYA
ncbi:hypothetical protein SISNIDRAFT_452892 [Sistotremastrum niveocremeum HHB9708]|uniref:DUF6534 domain-containing protein n=2 Tax=Sistotremastraceae TaxID=3402574 RepID=A0A164W6E5_9AGAM|nr:hypothetical protein SISNIDRAFT_452892 [Sistotremastrum niveocremeum HHB9708]KZT41696.1 hypothetical protein SISSUDRAFT_1042495 [Sistotremastrum suecicum HHB10207 ss-3]